MGKTETLKKRKASSMSKAPIVKLKKIVESVPHDPDNFLRDRDKIRHALTEAMEEGDMEAFREILSAHVKAVGVQNIINKTHLTKSTIYSAIKEDANPTIETIFQILKTGS
jgi:probable addiction module antidote protein